MKRNHMQFHKKKNTNWISNIIESYSIPANVQNC